MQITKLNKDETKKRISFDYDCKLTIKNSIHLAKRLREENTVYIISVRNNKDEILEIANELNIPANRVYATGSNKLKIEKIKQVGILRHYDNNKEVVYELGNVGALI